MLHQSKIILNSILTYLSSSNFIKLLLLTAFSLLYVSCGKMPLASVGEGGGAVAINCSLFKNGLSKASIASVGDSLVIEVSAPDMPTIRESHSIDLNRPVFSHTVARIPAGSGRKLTITTIDRNGALIHIDSVDRKPLTIEPNSVTNLNVVLVPSVGSIYLQLGSIPTKVDTVVAQFSAADNRLWKTSAKRSSKMYLSINRIPDKTRGMLSVFAIDLSGDTLYRASQEMTFNARKMESVSLGFSSIPGSAAINMDIVLPGVTNVVARMDGSGEESGESGELIITEIMYAANDSEYVEVYNPEQNDLFFDTLYLEIDITLRQFTNITIPSKGTFVFGRKLLPWCDSAHPVASALDLSSSGSWITIRTKKGNIIDRVIFTGGENDLEWPKVAGKQAISLDAEVSSAELNNFGRNWHAVTDLIPAATAQFGTPHIR